MGRSDSREDLQNRSEVKDKEKKEKRKWRHSESPSASHKHSQSSAPCKNEGITQKNKVKRKRGLSSSSSSSSSSSASHPSSREEKCKKRSHRSKKQKDKDRKRKKKRKKEKKKLKKLKKKMKMKNEAPLEIRIPAEQVTGSLEEQQTEIAITEEQRARIQAMRPMTKEEWDARQSVIRRVVDPETGRSRIIKGDGEVLEEIVSRERHKEINKLATVGDGFTFQVKMGLNQR